MKDISNIDDTYRVVTELLDAAEKGVAIRVGPKGALALAALVTKNRSNAAPYLEAAVRQCGGRLHLDTRHLAASTGAHVKYRPDHDHGSGGLLWIEDSP